MFFKIKLFLRYDIRNKLKSLNLYPLYFEKKGLKSLYSKLIFYLIFREKIKKIKKINYEKIFYNSEKKNYHPINYLVSAPSSGSMFLRNMFKSYFEIIHKVGNGIPKYDSINNQYMFSASPIISADMFNSIHPSLPQAIPEGLYIDNKKFMDNEEFQKTKIVFGRHPIQNDDLFLLKNIRPIILIRDPRDEIISTYMNHDRRDEKLKRDIDEKLINQKIINYKKFISFWYDYVLKKTKKDYLIVNFNSLTNSTEKTFEKILRFFNYPIDLEIIKKTSSIHTKENTLKLLSGIKIRKKIRFTDVNKKKEQRLILKDYLEKKLEQLNILDIYNKIEKQNDN